MLGLSMIRGKTDRVSDRKARRVSFAFRLMPCPLRLSPFALLLLFTVSFARPQDGDTSRISGDRVQCANLIYAGNKSSQCFSDRFLKRMEMETRIRTEPHFRKVRLDSRDLCNY